MVARGGAPDGSELDLILQSRQRLNAAGDTQDIEAQVKWFVYGIHPLLRYLDRTVGQPGLPP